LSPFGPFLIEGARAIGPTDLSAAAASLQFNSFVYGAENPCKSEGGSAMSDTTAAGTLVNGVELDVLGGTVEAIKGNSDLAQSKFRVRNTWIRGGHNRSTVGDFYGACKENSHQATFELEADEPPVLAGADLAPSPVEHLLHALASCLTTTLVYHAAIRGIQIEELECELEGDLDLRGFLGLSKDVRKGYENIRAKFRVKTDSDQLERLKAFSKLSPVFDVTSYGTQVDIEIERK
jgi:uncharacterized OsmC-like protein